MSEVPFPCYEQMVAIVGKRHAVCEFKNYDIGRDAYRQFRQKVVQMAAEYAKDLTNNMKKGRNVIFLGSRGAGKDHLAASIIRVAVTKGYSASCVRGSVFASECRQSIMTTGANYPAKYAEKDFVILSDAEPHGDAEKNSEFEQRAYMDLIDRRYCDVKPTIVTSNVTSAGELAAHLGDRAYDRLQENALIVPMKWPSFRVSS